MALKGNQGSMYEDIKLYFEKGNKIEDGAQIVEKKRGVVEIRRCKTARANWYFDRDKWKGLKTFFSVELESHYEGQVKHPVRYFISSLEKSAEDLLRVSRDHWSIENGLHRTLDVHFKEDASQGHNRNAASNLSILRKISLSVLKEVDPHKKLKLKLKEAAYSSEFRNRCLQGKF